jgi:hypothetical protein
MMHPGQMAAIQGMAMQGMGTMVNNGMMQPAN